MSWQIHVPHRDPGESLAVGEHARHLIDADNCEGTRELQFLAAGKRAHEERARREAPIA